MKVILYTEDFSETVNEPVDVILSPQYYWIKKIEIPIKSIKDAKKIAKSLFKLDDTYVYDAFELNGEFYAYAIKKDLDLKIDKKYINSLRLAQTELYKFEKFNVSQNHSIQKVEDLLFCFPKSENAPHINDILPKIELSKHKINIYDLINIDKSLIISGLIIFILINISLLLNIINNKNTVKTIEIKKEELIKNNNLPKTSFQLDSLINDLSKTNKNQINLRKNLEFITKTPLKKNEKFLKLTYGNKKFYIIVKANRNFDKYFSKKFKVDSQKEKSLYKAYLYE